MIAPLIGLPSPAASQATSPRLLVRQLRNPGVRVGILATFLLVTGHL
ncbi:hypothetical protein Acsp03_60380 [Actinomadura sp. NBRC 104412]|nr:hypothetical protein Acsp03_60380 [Actinomadura sp. NBRC 104412]